MPMTGTGTFHVDSELGDLGCMIRKWFQRSGEPIETQGTYERLDVV